ncbi:TfoX/Sxy family protein [Luteimonas aquatica]|uniref:TfoX/Sxy family protein n=1 Tax=Luteimonas aquatica TaxID=450364 RepID=UPI001F59707C|nr:TfoX/Sxy family protein [Luteimonas aquatica]
MRTDNEFLRYVLEQLSPLPDLRAAAFFSGIGIRSATAMFAMLMDGSLYFATDEATRPQYLALGSRRFSYRMKTRLVETKFFEVPAEIIDERERLLAFARAAIAVAERKAGARRGKRGA